MLDDFDGRSISKVVFVAKLGKLRQVDAEKQSLHLSSLCPSSAEQDLETEDRSAHSDPKNSTDVQSADVAANNFLAHNMCILKINI